MGAIQQIFEIRELKLVYQCPHCQTEITFRVDPGE